MTVPSPTEDTQDQTALFQERNRIARDLADALDNIGAVKAEFTAYQERARIDYAEIQLAAGKTLADVTDEMYEDARQALQRVKDRCWNEGYLEGINAAVHKIHELHVTEAREIAEGRDG